MPVVFILLTILAAAGNEDGSHAPHGEHASADPSPLLPVGGATDEDHPQLPHLLQVGSRIFSGAEPQGEAAFDALRKLGVKTAVCVDAFRPDVETANRYGVEYVHIPIGYDHISPKAGKMLARLIDESQGRVYIHCHHGKHRGPAAAAVACIAAGEADGESALKILKAAGTSEKYPGLWRDVAGYRRPMPGEEIPKLVSTAEVDSVSSAMANADRAFDNLKQLCASGWKPLADHPDLSSANETRKLKQALEQALKQGDFGDDRRLHGWLTESVAAASQLHDAIESNKLAAATRRFTLVSESCTRCHAVYRDK